MPMKPHSAGKAFEGINKCDTDLDGGLGVYNNSKYIKLYAVSVTAICMSISMK